MKNSSLAVLLALFTFTALGATPSADQVLADAKAKAAADHKAIFVHFGASWCGWCKKLDASLEQPQVKSAFERSFVPVKLVVLERGKNKDLENAGGEQVLKRLGGAGAEIGRAS